ncbi:MAG: ADP-ribosyl-[dinitrogen reductase] hydrolase [Candidatus Competibacteraceae bacterium]|nr:ADP-ribosyl-[dinitrogen reductase] hydrolase [Candidatus Competibacteraceae bacterium]
MRAPSVPILGLAVGDALGATVEFMLPREIRAQYGVHDQIRGGGWLKLPPGHVTDDTTMALALGEAILMKGRVDATAAAHAFDAWMRQKPVDIGNTVRRGILHFRITGQPWMPESPHDAGNGACMRVLPVALATLGQHPDVVRDACRAQAHVTHHNPLSDAATECVVLMVQAALQGADVPALLNGPVRMLLSAFPEFGFRRRRRENPSAYIVETLQAVLQALFDTDNFRDCLVDVVNRGGDADTTGAIAGMIAGALYGEAAIPQTWVRALDDRVRQHCQQQALALLDMAHRG